MVRGRQGPARDARSMRSTRLRPAGTRSPEMGAFIADRIVRCHIKTMARLNVGYDLLTWEGDILRLHFWATAFESLKARGAVFLQQEGRLTGCWVMPIESPRPHDRGDRRRDGRRSRGPREGHRPLERHGDLRRQGHREPVLEIRPARQGLLLPPVRAAGRSARCGRRRRTTARARARRRSAAPPRSTTSSIPGRPICSSS